MCSHFCKTAAYGHASAPLRGSVVCHLWRRMFDSTRIKLPRRCEARSYATYGPESTGGISAGFRSCLGRAVCRHIHKTRVSHPVWNCSATALVPCQSTGIQSPKTDFHKTPSALTQLEATAEAHRLNIECSKLWLFQPINAYSHL